MKKRLLNKIIPSSQNPLLSLREFYKYCEKRFDNVGTFEKDFSWLLNFYRKEGFLIPVYSEKDSDYYSTFQVYNLYLIESYRAACLKPNAPSKYNGEIIKFPVVNWQKILKKSKDRLINQIEGFNKLLMLLFKIQDFYLPEVRSNKRLGEYRDYHGDIAIGGTYFVTKKKFLLSSIRDWRNQFIKENDFNPQKILSDLNFQIEEIEKWTREISGLLKHIDPLKDWHLFLQYVNYDKRQKLKGNALLAQDFYEIAQILLLFLKDFGSDLSKKGISEIYDWFDLSPRDEGSKLPRWKERKYGKETLSNPYQMLEFLCNEFGINPKPKAIIFTEGEEWKAIKKLFEFYGFDPTLLGIEFKPMNGKFGMLRVKGQIRMADNTVAWKFLVEYLHEKQTLVYFLIDNENNNLEVARRLLKQKRTFRFHNLTLTIPSQDRLIIWGSRKKNSSFEEANFTDADITKAINKQVHNKISTKDIESLRNDQLRKQGLIEAIESKFKIKLNKPQLDIELVMTLIEKRKARSNSKQRTPLENFIFKAGKLILRNHQPTGKDHQKRNLETGLLG